tara:strand:+ start:1440 stop:2084 length:645 start_codon:yes stop_codon:yes gene_type:complete
MSTSIPEVANPSVNHALLVDLTLGGTTYKLTNGYKMPVATATDPAFGYQALGGFLQCGTITENIKATTGDLQLSLSGVPVDSNNYLTTVLGTTVKGGNVVVQRAFFDTDTGETTNVYQRFKGIITGFSVVEELDVLDGENTATVSITAASTLSILENQITGQRTNEVDRKRYFPTDTIMDRVKDLHNVQFDFGREFSSSGGGGGGGGRRRNIQR